jgi:hypothetical protein
MSCSCALVYPCCHDLNRESVLAMLEQAGDWYAAVRLWRRPVEQRRLLPWQATDWMNEHEGRFAGWSVKR